MTFRNLHQPGNPILIANVWDVPSAQAASLAGYQALGTSSAAIAANFGYPDGEEIPFSTLLLIVKRILKATDLPLSVDIEHGYGTTPETITRNILELIRLGAAGVNWEDSVVKSQHRIMVSPQHFAETIRQVISSSRSVDPDFFFNLRTDAFLLNHPAPVEETIHRAGLYAEAGADGLFVPGVCLPADIEALTVKSALPLNVMCWPGLPARSELTQLGVARISSGNFLHGKVLATQQQLFTQVRKAEDFSNLL